MSANANSKKPKTTLTEFNHPPLLGKLFNKCGKIAKMVNGSAKANPKPNMATIGRTGEPPLALSTITFPTIGPVQEKETIAKVSAIKKIP